jgi:HlyD family type I secretion membrane fusion protein
MPPLPSLIRPSRKDLLAGPISAFESETQAVFIRTAPYSEHAIMHLLVFIIVLTIVLMSVIKLDRVVTASGRLVPTRGTLYVQPLDKAIVREIKVHMGDVVRKGQALAELDPTFANADVNQVRDRYANASALVAREEAEQAGRPYEPGPTQAEQQQYSIWRQRQSEYQQTVADFDARIRSDESAVSKAQQDVDQYRQRLVFAKNYVDMQLELEKNGNTSKVKVLGAEDAAAEADRMLADARNSLTGAQHDLDSLKAQRSVAIGKWRDDLGTALAKDRGDQNEALQLLSKANRISDLITVEAPEDAVVLDIGEASTGSVVDSNMVSKPLFTLVPINGPLEAEVEINNQDIGFVKVGDHVEVKIDAYPFIQHGTAKGTITSISEGSFTSGDNTQQNRSAFFKARVRIDSTPLRNVPANFRLIPGMTVSGDVMMGRRTIMSYIITGVLRTGAEAMREPQ